MSENEKKPENLLLAITYGSSQITCTDGRRGHSEIVDDVDAYLNYEAAPRLRTLLENYTCGIVYGGSQASGGNYSVKVYQLRGRSGGHIAYYRPGSGFIPYWIFKELQPYKYEIVEQPFNTTTGEPDGDKLHLFAERGEGLPKLSLTMYPPLGDALSAKPFCQPKYRRTGVVFTGSTPLNTPAPTLADVATVAAAELTPSLQDIATRISALKGVLALATGKYDGVTEAQITAAVDHGYANPEVLKSLGETLADIDSGKRLRSTPEEMELLPRLLRAQTIVAELDAAKALEEDMFELEDSEVAEKAAETLRSMVSATARSLA